MLDKNSKTEVALDEARKKMLYRLRKLHRKHVVMGTHYTFEIERAIQVLEELPWILHAGLSPSRIIY